MSDIAGDSLSEIFKSSDFKIISELGRGSSSVVYKVENLKDKNIYAAKVQKIDTKLGKSSDLMRLFRREAVALARMKSSGVVRVHTVLEFESQACMIMEYVEGQSLELAIKNQSLTENDIVQRFIEIANALSEAHSIGIIHRDIKPQNIIISDRGIAKLIDFGFVVVESKKTDGKAQDFFGTMQYAAPEQTGLLKRPVDSRTDLYSLGVVLYEAMTGVPPFESPDIGILAYKHLNEPPPRIAEINPQVSPAMQQIIYKLLAKDPDDRYQSAQSLSYDLKNIVALNQAFKEERPVVLGLHQEAGSYSTFVGRDGELKILLNQWQKVQTSSGGVVLIEGDPGMGKSRLVKEALQRIHPEGSPKDLVILSGKAVLGDPLPLTVIKEAIDGFIRSRTSLKDEATKNKFIEKFKRAAGEFAPVLKTLTPSVSRLLGDQGQAEETFSQDIYQNAIVEFFIRISREFSSGMMILLIDDVQWVDDISNEIIKKIALISKAQKILILGTCRSDAQSLERLQKFLNEMTTVNSLLDHMVLNPLTQSSVQNYIESKLNAKTVSPDVGEQLFQKSSGNPFAAEEYLLAMLDSGFLKPSWDTWILDEAKMKSMDLPSDVVQLVIARLQYLTADARLILQHAALLGTEFSSKLVEISSDYTDEMINMAITEAQGANLIERDGEKYKFVHDRVREALIAEIETQNLKDVNQKIAEKIDHKVNVEKLEVENSVFLIARHYSQGLIEKNPQRVYSANYEAGQESLKNYANEESYELLHFAIQTAEKYKIEISLDFYQLIGEVCRITFKLKDAIEYFNKAISLTKDRQKRAHIMGLISNTYMSGWEIEGAWKTIKKSLAELGNPLPESVFMSVMSVMYYMSLNEFFRFINFTKTIDEKSKEAAELANNVNLLNIASEIAAFKHPMLIPISAFRAAYYSSRMKDNPLKAKAYATVGMLFQSFKMKGPSDFYYKKSMDMAVKLKNRTLMAECTYLNGVGCTVVGDIASFETIVNTIVEKYAQWINTRLYFDQIYSLGWIAQMKGQYDKAATICKDLILKSKNTKNSSVVYEYYSPAYYGTLLVMSGQVKEGMSHIDNQFKPLEKLDLNPVLGGDVYASKIAALWEVQDYGQVFEDFVKKVDLLAPNPMFSMFPLKNAYVCIAYIRFEQYLKETQNLVKANEQKLVILKKSFGKLKAAVQDSLFFKPHVLIINAGLCYIDNKFKKALKLLDEAEAISVKGQNNYSLYEVCRMKARIFAKMDRALDKQEKAKQALTIAMKNKWSSRAKWVKDEFDITEDEVSSTVNKTSMNVKSTVMQSSSSLKETIQMKKHLDSLLQVTLASSQVFDPKEQINIALDETINVMGADRAFVFLTSAKEEGKVEYAGGRIVGRQSLDEPKGYSSTVIRRVVETKQPILVTGTEEGEALGSESAVLHNLRSIMAVPLTIKDDFKGVLYIDSQLAKGIFTEDDTSILSGIANHIAITFESTRLANIEAQKRAMQKDLELSGAVQTLLLPRSSDLKNEYIHLAGFYRPASNCSGDWWWFENDDQAKNVFIFSGDVTGHGAGPAMITAMVASNFLTLRRSLSERDKLKHILEDMSWQLAYLAKQAYLMSAFAVNLDFVNKKISYFSAGGIQPVIFKKDGSFEFLKLSGAPLGAANTLIDTADVNLDSGDRIFIYTDGIVELMQPNGRLLGEKKLINTFKKYLNTPPNEATNEIIKELDAIRADGEQDDDYTLIICDIK